MDAKEIKKVTGKLLTEEEKTAIIQQEQQADLLLSQAYNMIKGFSDVSAVSRIMSLCLINMNMVLAQENEKLALSFLREQEGIYKKLSLLQTLRALLPKGAEANIIAEAEMAEAEAEAHASKRVH